MEKLNNFVKLFNILFPFSDFFYILQQEEYSSKRLVKWLPIFFFRRNFQVRDSLKYTKRVKITIVFTLFLWLGSLIFPILVGQLAFWVFFLLFWLGGIPFFVLMSNYLLMPYFENIKARIRRDAIKKVKENNNMKIIDIAGSYGKTTTKNFIYQLVRFNYKTQMIPGNINTPGGIASWINDNLERGTELLIAEVDTYERREIAKSCEMLSADIAIITNIGDQHLERFSSQEELADALFETFLGAKNSAILISTKDVLNHADRSVLGHKTVVEVDSPITLTYLQKEIAVPELSESNKTNLRFAIKVAEILSIPENFVVDTLTHLELPDRRQERTKLFGFDGIDDSYNISFSTALAGIDAAKQEACKAHKKLLVITAGIPELSLDNKNKNRKLGEILAQNVDMIVVLESIFADEIIGGIKSKDKYIKVKDLKSFLDKGIADFDSQEWYLLLQPELNDLYY